MKYTFLLPCVSDRVPYVKLLADSFAKQYGNRDDYDVVVMPSEYKNPCIAFNKAAQQASGDYFILTSPECMHETNILKGFDEEFSQHDCYVVCACKTKIEPYWYQHSKFNNRMLHFCSCISRKNWLKLNGFCEWFKDGIAYEDDDWLARVKTLNIPIICRDDLVVEHLEHNREYQANIEAINKNKEIYNFIWSK